MVKIAGGSGGVQSEPVKRVVTMEQIDFGQLKRSQVPARIAATMAASSGLSRLEIFKAVYDHWGSEPFTISELERFSPTRYPSPSARAAATVGLAALVLNFPFVNADDVADFEHLTGISRKVEALAKADRADDALRFYDRLEPDRLALQPITRNDARLDVAASIGVDHGRAVIDDEHTVEYHWGWLFVYREPDECDHARYALVDRFTGVGMNLGRVADPSDYCERYELTGWPIPLA